MTEQTHASDHHPSGHHLRPHRRAAGRGLDWWKQAWTLFAASAVMHPHVPAPYAELSRQDADESGIADGDPILIRVGDLEIPVQARVDGRAPAGIVLLPQRLSQSPTLLAPAKCSVQKLEE